MDHYILIANPSGRLSACPTRKDFNRGNFITEGMVVMPVAMTMETRAALWNNRDDAVILGESLPFINTVPGAVCFILKSRLDYMVPGEVANFTLYLEPLNDEQTQAVTLTADVCIGPLCKTVTGEQGEAIQPV